MGAGPALQRPLWPRLRDQPDRQLGSVGFLPEKTLTLSAEHDATSPVDPASVGGVQRELGSKLRVSASKLLFRGGRAPEDGCWWRAFDSLLCQIKFEFILPIPTVGEAFSNVCHAGRRPLVYRRKG